MPSSGPVARFGDYELVRPIAQGGMGAVYEVLDRKTGMRRAAKTILRPDDPQTCARFRREASLMARCDAHRGIVKVHAYGEAPDGAPYLILDLVQGEGLDDLLRREGRLDPTRAAELASDIAVALAFVHERGIVHRDVKPSNVLMDEGGTPRLTDFGIATARDVERLTKTGTFVGTLDYCAPEQATGSARQIGPWTDAWSVGAVLFHMLAGEPPLAALAPLAILDALATSSPIRDVRSVAPGTPDALAAIVSRALAKDLQYRYEGCAELAQDLERFLTGEAPVALGQVRREARRRASRPLAVALAAVAIGIVAVGVGGVFARQHARSVALEEARLEIARGDAALHRLAGGAALDDAALEAVRASVGRGRAALGQLRPETGEGSEPSGASRELDRIAAAVETLAARRALATGDAASALARLDAVPGGLDAEGRYLRASALVRLGREGEAKPELERLAVDRGSSFRPAAAEVLGDVALASGEAARASELYGTAAEPGGPDALRARAKRAGALALAGQADAAFRDLAAVLPESDYRTIESSDPRAAAAPALYLRATRVETPREQGLLLDVASRLGTEPPSLRVPVARAWSAVASYEVERFQEISFQKRLAPSDIGLMRTAYRHFARALALDPGLDRSALRSNLASIRLWGHTAEPAIALDFARALHEELASEPGLLVILGELEVHRAAKPTEETAAWFRSAARAMVDHPEDDTPEIPSYALSTLHNWLTVGGNVPPVSDCELAERLAARVDQRDAWLEVASAYATAGQLERSLLCIDRFRLSPGEDASLLELYKHNMRIRMFRIAHQEAAALELARRVHDEHPGDERYGRSLAHVFLFCNDPAHAIELFPGDPEKYSDVDLLADIGEAHARLGHTEAARAFGARLEALKAGDRAFWLHPDKAAH